MNLKPYTRDKTLLAKKNILIIPPTISTKDLQMTKRDADHNWRSPHYGVIRLTDYLNKNGHNADYFNIYGKSKNSSSEQ